MMFKWYFKELGAYVLTEISLFLQWLDVWWIIVPRQVAGWTEFIKNARSTFPASFWYQSHVITPFLHDKRASQSCIGSLLVIVRILYKPFDFIRFYYGFVSNYAAIWLTFWYHKISQNDILTSSFLLWPRQGQLQTFFFWSCYHGSQTLSLHTKMEFGLKISTRWVHKHLAL